MKLNQPIQTPYGPAFFIGMVDDTHMQVSRIVPASELSKDDCIRLRPVIARWTQIDFINWQRTARFCRNEIYAVDQVRVM